MTTPPPDSSRACRQCAKKAGWKPSGGTATAVLGKCRYCGAEGYHLSDHDYGIIFDRTWRKTDGR